MIENQEDNTKMLLQPQQDTDKKNEKEGEEKTKNLYKWYHVNLAMIPAKSAFFFENCKRLGYTPNMVLFLTGVGLNKAQAGFVIGFRLIGMMIGAPFWGILADKYSVHKLVITIMCILSVVFTCSQGFVSIHYGDKDKNVCPVKVTNSGLNISKKANVSFINSTFTLQPKNSGKVGTEFEDGKLLSILFAINLIACFFEGGISSFIDTGVVRQIQMSIDRTVEYGKQRLYASIGAAVGIVVTNSIVDGFPRANITCLAGIFVAYLMFTILEYGFMMLIYKTISFKEGTDKEPSRNIKVVLRRTILHFDVLFFYLTVFVSGVLYAQYTSFTLVYLKELGAESFLLSLAIVISSLSGITSFYFAQNVINLVGGPLNAICLAFFFYTVRYLIFTLIANPWFALFAQPLHAVSSILTVASCITHIKKIAPSQIMTTMCSFFNTLHYGVGNIVGSSVGGVIYDRFGGKMLFMFSCILGFFWCLVLLVYLLIRKRRVITNLSKDGEQS